MGRPICQRDLRGDIIRLGDEGIHGFRQNLAARGERQSRPRSLGALRGIKRPIDAGGRFQGAFDVDRPSTGLMVFNVSVMHVLK